MTVWQQLQNRSGHAKRLTTGPRNRVQSHQMHGPIRLVAMVCAPLLAFRGCSPWAKDAATALLVALPAAYCLSLAVVAVLVWLWRKQPETVDLEWSWLMSYAAVVAAIATLAASRSWPELEDLLLAGSHEALFICASLCVAARAAIELRSRLVMRIGAAITLAGLVVPTTLVFFVRTTSGQGIVLVMADVLFGPGRWLWLVVLITLFIEALARAPKSPDAPPRSRP